MRPELDPESILRDVREHDEDHAAMNITSCSTFFERGACPPLNFDIAFKDSFIGSQLGTCSHVW